MSSLIKAGFVQTQPEFGAVEANRLHTRELWGDRQADLLVLPELFNTGYQFQSLDEARELAETIPDGPTTQFLLGWAADARTVIVAGLAERAGDTLYNSAVIVGPEGFLGKFRKAHIFDSENNFFAPGDLPFTVYDTGTFKVGIMICFDWRFPETARTLTLQGAELIAHPSNLVLPHCPQAMITRCLENRVYAITADRVGTEQRLPDEPLTFIGQSQVVDPDGNVLYRASEKGEEAQGVEIDLERARNKRINSRNDLIDDRRVDLYRVGGKG
ncbi:MAG: acyltransferase [Nitrospinaceae bacterium]|nr:acyltransferase [Nitrospinaceae bacterium]NIR57160.1 acyltransferase [Nitrospinaceae bacterium]NIS87602.1 acyltransferase [Nitrospinaceae bacterium]NIT84473.1 acyltransferase [Nitrospinaceae bacterium]NIU46659.1 acyltransferase [Nitrospinaceae bacterium]